MSLDDQTRDQLAKFGLSEQQQRIVADHLASLLPDDERRAVSAAERAEKWRKRYWADPVAWARDNLTWPSGEFLASYQQDCLNRLVEAKRLAVVGPRGLGKTCMESIAILWFATTRDGYTDWKIPTTAGGYRQLEEYLWPEIHKWARRLRWDRIGRAPWSHSTQLMKLSLDVTTGRAFAAASNRSDLIEGAHASQVLYVFDESKSILEPTWDSVEGVFANAGTRGREAFMLACSTPGGHEGRFWAIHDNREDNFKHWDRRHVRVDECLSEGMVNVEWIELCARQWGTESAMYRNHCLGEFAAPDEHGIIPSDWVEQAVQRGRELPSPVGSAAMR